MMAAMLAFPAVSQEIHTGNGKPIRLDLGFGFHLNDGSSLNRDWVIVNDTSLPVRISPEGFLGADIELADRNYRYTSEFTLDVAEPVSAVRVLLVTFNVWNERVENLSLSEVADLDPGRHTVNGAWRVRSETRASEHIRTIAFVERVRLPNGQVLHADRSEVVAQAARISDGFDVDDLLADD